jgi:[ribosomal protein S5]-alanine N-acetyltransferase
MSSSSARDSIRIRGYREEDLAALPGIFGDWKVVQWMSWAIPHPYTEADAEAWMERVLNESPTENFIIEVSGRAAGGINILPCSGEKTGVAEMGFWLAQAYWGQGIATEAVRLFLPYVFGERRLRRVEAYLYAANLASARVLEKCGFTREAVLREAHIDRQGNVSDCLLYTLLAAEVTGQRAAYAT